MGGIGSAALTHAGTEIFPAERRITTSPDFLEDPAVRMALDPIRADGSRRDLDVLVLSADEEAIAMVEAAAERTVDGQLDVSVFGLHKAVELREQVANPFGWRAFKTFVSDRYLWESGRVDKALFPFGVELDREALETWSLEIGAEEFPVANPSSTVLNYLTRSISGLRPKDADKVDAMAGQVFAKAPELAEWAVDGPGKSQMELASILQTLRRGSSLPLSKRQLEVGGVLKIRAGSVRALNDHPAFMLRHDSADTRDAALAWAVVKARGLGIGESQDWVVTIFRKYFEEMVDGITKNGDSIGS